MHTSAVGKNYFDEFTEYKFDNFHAAFALVEHSTLKPVHDLERFVTLTVAQEHIENADFLNAETRILESHFCTEKELEEKFQGIESYIIEHWENYQCLDDPQNVEFLGNYERSLTKKNLLY